MTYEDNTAKLMIAGAYPEDDGEYVCSATNSLGTARCSCHLYVQGKMCSVLKVGAVCGYWTFDTSAPFLKMMVEVIILCYMALKKPIL